MQYVFIYNKARMISNKKDDPKPKVESAAEGEEWKTNLKTPPKDSRFKTTVGLYLEF